jgi:hypothetical protein
MSSADSTVLIVRNASVWLCENGRTEYEGYIRSISPLGFTAALSARNRPSATIDGSSPSGQPIPDLAGMLIGRRFVAALCGRDYSTIVDATATEIQKLTGSAFDYTVICRFNALENDQKKMIVGLIIEHYAPPSIAM